MRWFLSNRRVPSSEPRGLIFLCHGYDMECSIFVKGIWLAKARYAVHGIHYHGHGKLLISVLSCILLLQLEKMKNEWRLVMTKHSYMHLGVQFVKFLSSLHFNSTI
ncbi:hypothetical protein ACET3Z_018029 [Daucus carota]